MVKEERKMRYYRLRVSTIKMIDELVELTGWPVGLLVERVLRSGLEGTIAKELKRKGDEIGE